jgi:eukaryotic-like serine/threonine-protein kinase
MRILILFLISAIAFPVKSQPSHSGKAIPDFKTLPSVKWKFRINQPILSSPVIDGSTVFFGGLDSMLYALDINSSKVQWKFRTKGAIRSSVLIRDNILYLNGGDGNLYAIEKKTGKLKWTFTGKGEKKYDFADYHQSSPILYNNVLYFGAGDYVYAVKSENGTSLWSYQTGDAVHTTPALENNKLFVGSFDGNVYALDATGGSLLWKFKTVGHRFFPKGEVQGSPAVAEGMVFIGARDYNVYALDQNKGFSRWNKAFTRGWCLVNTFYDSVLYTAGADERVLIAADPLSGREFYRQKMEFLVFGNNAYSETMLYVGTTNGKFHGINMKTGEKVWSFVTDGYTRNRLKYFKEDDSYRDDIYSIIKSNEHFLEVEYELGGIFSTPAITHDLIIITTTEGVVYSLSR